MQKIDDCKEIRLALTRAGIATCPEKCLQTFRLVVTAQYIYHSQLLRFSVLRRETRDMGGSFSRRPIICSRQLDHHV
jgi:hypothetical protein